MKCPSSEEMAALYDGTLPKKYAEPVRFHLARCSRCAQEFRTLHTTLSELDAAPPPPSKLINLIKNKTLSPKTMGPSKSKHARRTGLRSARRVHK